MSTQQPQDLLVDPVEVKAKIKDFDELLKQIEGLSDKKKILYREIYQNAVIDRQNAYAIFMKLVVITSDKSTEHAVHGRTMATYIERMSKANDQLIKLTELIARTDNSDENNIDDLFDKIKNG